MQLVCTWLRRQLRNKWLFVIDNVDYSVAFRDGPKEELGVESGTLYDLGSPFSKFIPETRNGFVLITSRSRTIARRLTGDVKSVLTVEPMPLDDARTLLRIHLKADEDVKDVDQFLENLSRIPLALKQAAAYINKVTPRLTLKKFTQELLESGSAQAELLYPGVSDVRRESDTAKSIGQTWQLVLYHIREMAPHSINLLSLASMFDPDDIHQDLLMSYDYNQTATAGYQRKSKAEFEIDMSILKSYSLIKMNEHSDSFVMHRLVQSWLKAWLEGVGELEKWKVKFLSILSWKFPRDPYTNMAKCESIFSHAVLAMTYRPADVKHLELYATVLESASSYARAIGKYRMAETMSEAAYHRSTESPSAGNSSILRRALSLALIFEDQNKWRAATDLIHDLYVKRIESHGRHHPDTLACAAVYSLLLLRQEKAVESLYFMEQILIECVMALGPKHPNTSLIMNAVSLAYRGMGQVDKALALQKKVDEGMGFFKDRATLWGMNHPPPINSSKANRLEAMLISQNRAEETQSLERQGFQTSKRALASEYPRTLAAMAHLAARLDGQSGI